MMWVALGVFGAVAYVLALIFVVPDTAEAHAVAQVLFACFGIYYALASFLMCIQAMQAEAWEAGRIAGNNSLKQSNPHAGTQVEK